MCSDKGFIIGGIVDQLVKRIVIIGNAGGGKTTLSRHLASIHRLPLTHVDSIQFIAGMKIRPHQESISILSKIQNEEKWIIDGYGPLDILENRLMLADQIIFIDLPLWRHSIWCLKRQIKSLWSPREELPANCEEATLGHTIKLFKTIWKVHKLMRPEMLRILGKENIRQKVVMIKNVRELKALATS